MTEITGGPKGAPSGRTEQHAQDSTLAKSTDLAGATIGNTLLAPAEVERTPHTRDSVEARWEKGRSWPSGTTLTCKIKG